MAPKDADTLNHKLLTQAGFVDQLMAGVYSYYPLGLRVLNNIGQVVREEMDAIGGQEVLMPILHPKSIWETTGGWDKIDVLFKLKSRTEKEYALGQSEEEVVTPLTLNSIRSYKDLPIAPYQINWKYRDELRSKSGIMRGREFLMKDMYSFHESNEDFLRFYEVVKASYLKIYSRLSLTAKVTEASGGAFTEKISYEFMVLTDAGEDDILYCDQCDYCVNCEIAKVKAGETCKCGLGKLSLAKASEVGNVFDLGQKYGKDFDLGYTDKEGKKQFPFMGCYGIGISRLMGVLVEKFADSKGLLWPESVAPFTYHLISLSQNEVCGEIYAKLKSLGASVLFDDRQDATAGEKFFDADLIGIPVQIIVGSSYKKDNFIEIKYRKDAEVTKYRLDEFYAFVSERIRK